MWRRKEQASVSYRICTLCLPTAAAAAAAAVALYPLRRSRPEANGHRFAAPPVASSRAEVSKRAGGFGLSRASAGFQEQERIQAEIKRKREEVRAVSAVLVQMWRA